MNFLKKIIIIMHVFFGGSLRFTEKWQNLISLVSPIVNLLDYLDKLHKCFSSQPLRPLPMFHWPEQVTRPAARERRLCKAVDTLGVGVSKPQVIGIHPNEHVI